ncbi:MAG TPA: diguanylate cyclase response regulator, partial [Desulfobacteraceae bacterium]|nr:diguanylate cyclase response regulator [Desulfobacteraceae bacterium]
MAVEDIDYSAELILVVDDEEMIREIVCEMFGHLGLKSHAVGSGKEALVELKKERPYTFLLTDISMPVMNGVDLIKKVRKKYPKICTIAMTGHSREYKYIDVVNAGAMDFINKPLGIEELEAKVRRGIIERNIREKLNRMSITDSLTGLYNQRHFYTTLKYEVIRAERQKYKLGLILLDLDNFKYFNDTYGHLAGDELLQKVGEIIEVNIRKGVDSGYRYGGDEFAI